MDIDDLSIVQSALEDGEVEVAKDMVADLINLDNLNKVPTEVIDSVTGSGKGDLVVGIITIGAIGGLIFFAIRAAIKEEKRYQENLEKAKQKAKEEEERINGAISRGATILPKPDGGYYVIENEHSTKMLKEFTEKENSFKYEITHRADNGANSNIIIPDGSHKETAGHDEPAES